MGASADPAINQNTLLSESGNTYTTNAAMPKSLGTIDSGSWGYVNGAIYRSASSINRRFDSVLAKGGVLILNVSPMANGTLPQAQQDIRAEIGSVWACSRRPPARAACSVSTTSRPWRRLTRRE